MPHERPRIIADKIAKSLKWSPAVGVYGLRQVGKTTLVKHLIDDLRGEYVTLDNESLLEASRLAPVAFCDKSHALCIDEAQKAPWLFPCIKDRIGTRRKPSRFLLTGSVRFTLRAEIREALTGRIVLHELLPFTLGEAAGRGMSGFLATYLAHGNPPSQVKVSKATPAEILRYLRSGGLPIPCFTRDVARQQEWFRGYFETMILRDVPLVDPALKNLGFRQGTAFLRQLAIQQGREVNLSQLAAASTLRLPKAIRLLRALETLALIDLIPPEIHAAKSSRKLRIEWKDVALWHHFAGVPGQLLSHDPTAIGVLIAHEFRAQISLMEQVPSWTYYRTRDGADIPWILRSSNKILAACFINTESVGRDDLRAIRGFLKREPKALGVVFLTEKAPAISLGERLWMMPYTAVLS